MKRIFKIVGLCIVLGLAFSCAKDDENIWDSENDGSKEILIRKRVSKVPIVVAKRQFLPVKQSINSLELYSYLGRSYNIRKTSIGSPEGVGYPTFKIKNYLQDYPGSYLEKNIKSTDIKSFAFTTFEKYSENGNKTKTVNGGANVSIFGIGIGARKDYKTTFNYSKEHVDNRVFGELNISVIDKSYSLFMSTNRRNMIMEKYLENTFLDEMFNTSAAELAENYGEYIITDFLSGGRARAIYMGSYLSYTTTENFERNMNSSINATFNISNIGGGGDLAIGNISGSNLEIDFNITNLLTSVKTYGGEYGLGVVISPTKIDNVNLNLTSWLSSLNNPANSVLIDINENGLFPIKDIIPFDNIKLNYENKDTTGIKEFQEPKLIVNIQPAKKNAFGGYAKQRRAISIDLITRHGNIIKTKDLGYTISKNEQIPQMLLNDIEKVTNMFDLDVVIKETHSIENSDFNFSTPDIHFKKFRDPNYNLLYLVNPSNMTAYVIKDDFVLETYGLKSWIDNISSITPLSYSVLQRYTVIAL